MKFYIITLFPKMFVGPLTESMLFNAKSKGLLDIEIINLRDFGIGKRKTVDDIPYGGGAGMVLKPEPIFAAIESIKDRKNLRVVMMTPSGKKYNQQTVKKLSKFSSLAIICGHYEGIDERVSSIVDEEISIGDYVLTGGEIPAMVLVDSVARLVPGVLGDERSSQDESFSNGILEYPQYTRPDNFRGKKIPEILKSGHHAQITQWRKDQAIKKTRKNHPDLLEF